MTNPTNFKILSTGQDLSDLFAPLVGGTQTITT